MSPSEKKLTTPGALEVERRNHERALAGWLSSEKKNGTLRLKGGRVSIRIASAAIGVSEYVFKRDNRLLAVLRRIEEKENPGLRLPELKRDLSRLLRELRATGRLPYRKGKVSRAAMARLLGVRGAFLRADRELCTLIEPYDLDARIGEDPAAAQTLAVLLEKAFREGRIAIRRARVSREGAARLLGISRYHLKRVKGLTQILKRFDRQLAKHALTADGRSRELKELLERHRASGTLKVWAGRISRSFVSDLLGMRTQKLLRSSALMVVIKSFEAQYEAETRQLVAPLQAWLDRQISAGTLRTCRRKVARKPICRLLGLSVKRLEAHGPVQKLLARYEKTLFGPQRTTTYAKDKLASWLKRLHAKRKVPLIDMRVNRTQAARQVRMTPRQLMAQPDLRALVERYDRKVKLYANKKRIPLGSFAAAIRRAWLGGRLQYDRGVVRRAAVSAMLEVSPDELMTRVSMSRCLEHYDTRTDETGWRRRMLVAAEDWLSANLKDARLRHSRAGISKTLVARSLGLTDRDIAQFPAFLKLLDRYQIMLREKEVADLVAALPAALDAALAGDALVRTGRRPSYVAVSKALGIPLRVIAESRIRHAIDGFFSDYDLDRLGKRELELIERLQAILALDHCPTTRAGLAIDQLKVSSMLGISPQKLMRPPLRSLVDDKNADLERHARKGGTGALLGGRYYSLVDYVQVLGPDSIAQVATRFASMYEASSPSLRAQAYAELRGLLSTVAHGLGAEETSVRKSFTAGIRAPIGPWRHIVRAACSQIDTSSTSPKARTRRLSILRGLVSGLANTDILPAIAFPPTRRHRRAERKAGRIKTVAEVGIASKQQATVDPYLQFVQRLLPEAAARLEINVDADAIGFVAGIGAEIVRAGGSVDPHPEIAIREILQRRLLAIKVCAETTIVRWMDHFQQRDELRSEETLTTEEGRRLLLAAIAAGDHDRERGATIRQYFPSPEDEKHRKIGLANLLALIERDFAGIVPSDRSEHVDRRVQVFFNKMLSRYGGSASVEAYLHPHRSVLSATLTLYLCESGANVSVGRTLPVSCIEETDDERVVTVTGYKSRANGRPIQSEFMLNSSLIRALTWIRDDVRSLPGDRTSDSIFTLRVGTRHQLLSENQLRAWFTSMTKGAGDLDGLPLTPRMIRPSVILLKTLESDGKHRAGMAIGQHTGAVTEGYQNRWPTRIIYDANIRRFQGALEALISANISDAALKLGLDASRLHENLSELQPTGFGTFCARALGGAPIRRAACDTADCWNNCPSMVFVAELEAVVTVQLWQRSLRVAAPEWERDRAERWDAFWVPWLCMFDVIEEKMVRGPGVAVWNAATVRRGEYERSPSFVAPQPW